MPWFQVIWLLLVLALALSGMRAYRVGARKGLVMALLWAVLFVLVAGIAGMIADNGNPLGVIAPPADAPFNLT